MDESNSIIPRVVDDGGNLVAWWDDSFQAQLEHHPQIKRIADEKEKCKKEQSTD